MNNNINAVICNIRDDESIKDNVQLFFVDNEKLIEEPFPLEGYDEYDNIAPTELQFASVEVEEKGETVTFKITNLEKTEINIMESREPLTAFETIVNGDFEKIILSFTKYINFLNRPQICMN